MNAGTGLASRWVEMFPIVPYATPELSFSRRRRAETLAEALRGEKPELEAPERYRSLTPRAPVAAPAVHLDDQSGITSPKGTEATHFQDRARLRAEEGDYVVTALPAEEAYEAYCRERLGLGAVEWLTAEAEGNPRRLANHAMRDREVRRVLVRAMRREGLLYLHPYLGSKDVWELALALARGSRRPLQVLAPHPELARWVNDKVHFAEVVTRLLGERFVPETYEASSLSTLSDRVRELAQRKASLVVKLPGSAAGAGNVLLHGSDFVGRSLQEIHRELQILTEALGWRGETHLLVSAWTEGVLAAPSVQLWIPPLGVGDPVVEGLFEQRLEGQRFTGSRRAQLPRVLAQEIAVRSALLGLTFQHLGYVGRCSFDLVLASDRIEFIEANGRWGGTSTPMTLMNRLLGRWWDRPYVAQTLAVPGLERVGLAALLDVLHDKLFDAATARGDLVLFNPATVEARGHLSVIALGEDLDRASELVATEVRRRLEDLVGAKG